MTTKKIFRDAALTFPQVDEHDGADKLAYSINGRQFAALSADGQVMLHLPAQAADEAMAAYPAATRLMHAGRPIGFVAPLRDVGGQHLWALVMAAYKHRAPKKLAGQLDAIVTGRAAPESDLPPAIGKAATRALLTAGLTSLDKVAGHSEQQLLAMHGVGPKAVRILAEALAERGMSSR